MLKEFGQDLKFLRESKNITIAEISAETRINPKFFTNFESGIFNFQPETYVRAFLKEYANCIGEDETQILFDYEKAKSGFYDRKFVVKGETAENTVNKVSSEILSPSLESELKDNKDYDKPSKSVTSLVENKSKDNANISYGYIHPSDYYDVKSNQKKRFNQRIFLGIILLLIAAGIIFLINYLNKSSQHKQSSDIKPKSFDEISEDYETKLKGRTEKDIQDSIKNLTSVIKSDSLTLTVRAAKEVRIKVYLDENQLIEEIIPAGDSLSLKAKDQFRFSASINSSFDLFLDGKLLQKPKNLAGTSIKNLIIRKEGIVTQ